MSAGCVPYPCNLPQMLLSAMQVINEAAFWRCPRLSRDSGVSQHLLQTAQVCHLIPFTHLQLLLGAASYILSSNLPEAYQGWTLPMFMAMA